MKEYIRQFYSEGFGSVFYQKPVKYLDNKIKNKKFVKFLSIIIKILYTIIFVSIAFIVLFKKLGIKFK